jgi:streptomycin 6-kinase
VKEGVFTDTVRLLSARWGLSVGGEFPSTPGNLGNFVAPVVLVDGTRAVLKVSRSIRETRQEIAALRVWNGLGAARLLEADEQLGALLLERVEPGTMLSEVDDDVAVQVAAGVLRQLWQPPPAEHGLRSLEQWCETFERNRRALSAGEAGFPARLFQHADALRQQLLDSTQQAVALHGDLHHFNVLRSNRSGWLAIDPKGLVGDRCFDVCQFLVNPGPVTAEINRRRLDMFSHELGLDRRRLAQWVVVHAVLNACWYYEDRRDWRRSVEYAEETLTY